MLAVCQYTPPPWKAIFTSRPVLVQFFYYMCDGIGFYILFSVIPFYLKEVLHYNISQVGCNMAGSNQAKIFRE